MVTMVKIFQELFFKQISIFLIESCLWKKNILCKVVKTIFQKMKSSKIDQWQLGCDNFLPTSKAYNQGVFYSNEKFYTPK